MPASVDHLAVAHRRHRRDAGAHRLSVDVHRAGTALREAAAEVRIVQAEIVAQGVEQRHVRLGLDRLRLAVDVEIYSSHGCGSPLRFASDAAAKSRGTRLRAPAVHFAAIANCSSVAKLVQPAAQGNTPGAAFLAEFVLRWLHAWLCFWLCLHARLCRAHAEAQIRISRCEAAIQLSFFKRNSPPWSSNSSSQSRGALRRPRRVTLVRIDPERGGGWSADRRTLSFGRACAARPPCPGATGTSLGAPPWRFSDADPRSRLPAVGPEPAATARAKP